MPLSRGEINPLGILGLRKLPFIPEHFKKIHIEHNINTKIIEQWIEFHLSGRYAIVKTTGINDDNKFISSIDIGLEDPKEMTILALSCSHIHKQKEDIF